MKRILQFMKSYKIESILGPLFKMLEASFELLIPILVGDIIDIGIREENQEYIINKCMIMAVLGLVGMACSITAQYFSAKAAAGFSVKLRHAVFTHIQDFSFSEIDRIGTSTLITRLTSDINQVQTGVNLVLRLFLRSPFIVFGAMIMAFTISSKAAFIFLSVIILLSVIVFGIMLAGIPLHQKVQEGMDRIYQIIRENLTGVRVLRAFCKEEDEIRTFLEKNTFLQKAQMTAGRVSACMNPLTYVVVNAGIVLLLYRGASDVDTGILSRGEVVKLVNYMSQILVELVKLANLILTMIKAYACAGRIEEVLLMPAGETEQFSGLSYQAGRTAGAEETAGTACIMFEHVSFTYQGAGGEALTDISFSIEKGETVGIIGGTGSGKTSLVHLIPRFYDIDSGRICINGTDIKEYDVGSLRRNIGIVMQEAVLFQGTIRENLAFGLSEGEIKNNSMEMEQAATAAQAAGFIAEREAGYYALVQQNGRNFSGGQRQRLSIARALAKKPSILILDDSFSALDTATDEKLKKAIRKRTGMDAVLLVSQRITSIQHSDKIIVLEDGKIAGIGKHEELLSSCSIYQEIYASQKGRR